MSGPTPASEFDAMANALDEVRKDWLKRPGVTAVDVGYRWKAGKPTDSLAVRVHVRRKLPKASLPPNEVFPEHLGPFEVDVIEAEYGSQAD